ncbi:hypothetical protein SAMD00019534_076880, partial [Acytostelium subglobosum LB1]|uniref:hypothetical protein n=1 Tax=Acytostelium subglobosum LB1 TaxID=1410327 RepID=UPI000644817D
MDNNNIMFDNFLSSYSTQAYHQLPTSPDFNQLQQQNQLTPTGSNSCSSLDDCLLYTTSSTYKEDCYKEASDAFYSATTMAMSMSMSCPSSATSTTSLYDCCDDQMLDRTSQDSFYSYELDLSTSSLMNHDSGCSSSVQTTPIQGSYQLHQQILLQQQPLQQQHVQQQKQQQQQQFSFLPWNQQQPYMLSSSDIVPTLYPISPIETFSSQSHDTLSVYDLNNTLKLVNHCTSDGSSDNQLLPDVPLSPSEDSSSTSSTPANSRSGAASPKIPDQQQQQQPYTISPSFVEQQRMAHEQLCASPKSEVPSPIPEAPLSPSKPKKLIDICDLFIKEHTAMVRDGGKRQVFIDAFALKHSVDLTRMYSILHVMKCIGIIEKRGHNSYHWLGMNNIRPSIEAIFHSTHNYLTGELEFVCDKCKANYERKLSGQSCNTEGSGACPSPMNDAKLKQNTKLSLIYKQFIKLFFLNDTVSCKNAKEIYHTHLTTAKSRRLYDMALILDSINLITKTVSPGKNKIQYYKWNGSPTLDELRESSCLPYLNQTL